MWVFLSFAAIVAAPKFADIPKGHWAEKSVANVVGRGYMNGLPSGKFDGEKPVTRFEFAVALDRFVRDVEKGLKDAPKTNRAKEHKVGVASKHWAFESLSHLLDGGYLPPDSPIFSDKVTTLTMTQTGKAMGQIAVRIVDLHADPDEPHFDDEEKKGG